MGKFFKNAGVSAELLDAAKKLDWAKARKDFIGPGIVIGGAAGLATTAITGGIKDERGDLRPINITKGIAAGIGVDALTGLGQAVWKRRNELKEVIKK